MSCVLPNSPTPFQHEDTFDFPFLDHESGMDYYLAGDSKEESSMPRVIPSRQDKDEGDVDMNDSSVNLSGEHDNSLVYAPYSLAYQTSLDSQHFHPYRQPGFRSPRHMPIQQEQEPLSPPLSVSPPGSAPPRAHASLIHTPPAAISPSMVSPGSGMSPISDISPPGVGWTHPLPYTPGTMYGAETPGPGMSMVAGFPYPTVPTQQHQRPGSSGRSMRSRSSRNTKREEEDSEEEDERSGIGLGFSTSPHDDRPPMMRREDVRKARIESEQRRRDELREGFRRLKEALPESSQRSSKSNLLDRAVAHIQQIESANRYLVAQLEKANTELVALRSTNAELVHAVAMNTRAGSASSSPGANLITASRS